MRKLILVMSVLVVIVLTACGTTENNKQITGDNPIQKNMDANNKDATISDDGSTNHDQEKIFYHNDIFKDVTVTEDNQNLIVTGKAQVFEGVFQYAVMDGEKVVKQDRYQTDGAPTWGSFTISFAKDLATEASVMELFVYSSKDGEKTNTLEIPLNRIK